MSEILLTNADDMTPMVFQALEKCRDGDTLKFQPLEQKMGGGSASFQPLEKQMGEGSASFHFWPESAFEKYYYVTNNRMGLKRIAFPIIGKKNLTIDGGGATFIFHGEIVPFILDGSENVTIKNCSIDWKRPFYSQGEIVRVDDDGIEVKMDRDKYPYHLEGETILFDGEGWSSTFHEGVFEMDVKTGGPAWRSGDSLGQYIAPKDFCITQVDENTIRFNNRFVRKAVVGNILLMRHYQRHCPGIYLFHAKDTCIENVNLYHCGAMGVLGQFADGVHLKNLTVQPTPGSGRFFSVTVDATHFCNCRGMIRIEDCRFENQMDDPINVHGIFSRIKERVDEHSVLAELVHPDQYGVEIGLPGDRINLVRSDTLLPYATLEIERTELLDSQFVRVVFKEKLPDELRERDALENMDWMPDLHVSGCFSHNNRARGYLISTPGKVLIEDNYIASSGAALKICGDAYYWFESGAVHDMVVRNNTFGDSCYGNCPEWGRAIIDIDPELEDPWANLECYHRNIRIEGNTFKTFDSAILYARSVEGLVFKDNVIEKTDSYPAVSPDLPIVRLNACRNAVVEGNQVSPELDVPFLEEVNERPADYELRAPLDFSNV